MASPLRVRRLQPREGESRVDLMRRYFEAGRSLTWIGKLFNLSQQRVSVLLGQPLLGRAEHPMNRRRQIRLRSLLRRLPHTLQLHTEADLTRVLGFPARPALRQVGQWERVAALLRERRRQRVKLAITTQVRRYAKHLGRTPTMRELRETKLCSQGSMQRCFGTIRQLQRESGCLPTPVGFPGHVDFRKRGFKPEDVADVV